MLAATARAACTIAAAACCWLVTVSSASSYERRLGAGRCRRRGLARAEAREIEHVGKHHLHAGRPVGAVETEPARRRHRAGRSGSPRCRARTRWTGSTRAADPSATSTSSCARATSTAAWRTCASGCVVGGGGAARRPEADRASVVASIVTAPVVTPSTRASVICAERHAPAAPGSAASARRRVRRRSATLRRPAAADCRRACGRRGDSRSRRSTSACSAATARWAPTMLRNAAPTAVWTSRRVSASPARARATPASALATVGLTKAEVERLPREQRARRASPDAAAGRRRQDRT